MKPKNEMQAEAQHATVCSMVDQALLKNRQDSGGGQTEFTLVKLDCYIVGFQAPRGSVFENHLQFHSRRYRLVNVDNENVLIPERIAEQFAADVRKRFPSAKVELKEFVTFG